MPRILKIDAAARTVTAVDCPTAYSGIKEIIPDMICIAAELPAGDVVFVDDEGLLKPTEHFFAIAENPQPLAGNGVVVGRDDFDDNGDEVTRDVTLTPQQMADKITWLTRAEFAAWATAQGNRPAVSITTLAMTASGTNTEVLATYPELLANMPQPPAI